LKEFLVLLMFFGKNTYLVKFTDLGYTTLFRIILKYFADPKKWIKDYEVSAVSRKDSMVLELIKLASK